jgi:type I restriction enzyme R subunit
MRDALPNADFIGFTGTPIEHADANTRAVFGDYISVYDIQRAVEDGATVPIYYESRLAKLELDETERPRIDPAFEEVTEGEEVETRGNGSGPSGRSSRRSSAPRNGSGSSPRTWSRTSSGGSRRWTARPWSSA